MENVLIFKGLYSRIEDNSVSEEVYNIDSLNIENFIPFSEYKKTLKYEDDNYYDEYDDEDEEC